jgi:hypothetical protein
MPKETTTDESVLSQIEKLAEEEQALYSHEELEPQAQKRLQQIQIQLDQCWDLLRQRRALREFGKDPDEAEVRPAKVVEDYEN